ncbi:hypothetical protein FRC04_011497 [Tulasnella sp. 424]|nr:hypothetical protein FRC04_011497 [Tulasnella sp. 424]KAG8971706.1 hypothetical protein FRC05_010872 [Tulasnella sp. 425]
MIKLTAAGITDSTPHRTRASLRHGTSPSGDMYITPAPADLIRWKHHQFHPQPPSPLIPSDLLPSSSSSSPDMSYHHSSMSRPVFECRYCSPGRTFDDWRPLAIHEACDHADILNRIPCPADGCDKHYAQLKYLITHYNIQNARADLVKQHCKKKHPTLGDLTTSQLESEPSPISEPQACPGDATSSSSFVFHAQPTPAPSASCVNLDPALDSDEQLQQQGLPTSAPPVSRYALAQAAETRRQQMIVELRASHVGMSGLTEDQFDLALPEYPIKSGSSTSSPDHPTGIVGAAGSTNNMYIQGTNDEFFSGFDTSAPTATHHHHQHHAQQQQHAHQHQGTMSAPTTPTRGSPVGSYHHMQSTTTTPVHELSAPSWHDATTTTTTGAQAPSSSLGGLIPATTHHQHHYAQGGGANYQLATAPAGHHHAHHQHHPHHSAHPHHSPSSSSASYQTRPPLHPSGYPGPPHSSPSRSSSIGSYYSPTSPAGWAADPALGLMGTGTTTTTTASAGSAYPASTTTPPAMEYVGGQAWTQSATTAGGAGGPQEYLTLSNFQGQHAHHRRDYSI